MPRKQVYYILLYKNYMSEFIDWKYSAYNHILEINEVTWIHTFIWHSAEQTAHLRNCMQIIIVW